MSLSSITARHSSILDTERLGDALDSLKECVENLETLKSPDLIEFKEQFSMRLKKMCAEIEIKKGQAHVTESGVGGESGWTNSIFNYGKMAHLG